MSDQDKKKTNTSDELIDIKSLIRGADGGGFTLDEILSEYGAAPGKAAPPTAPDQVPPQDSAQEKPPRESGEDLDLPWPQAPRRPHRKDNVVAFPGTASEQEAEEDAPDAEPEEDQPPKEAEFLEEDGDGYGEDEEEPSDFQDDKVIEFPEEESPLTSFIKDLKDRADNYADQMFEESEQMDPDEVRRLEELIPGTDREEDGDGEEDFRFVRPRRRE